MSSVYFCQINFLKIFYRVLIIMKLIPAPPVGGLPLNFKKMKKKILKFATETFRFTIDKLIKIFSKKIINLSAPQGDKKYPKIN